MKKILFTLILIFPLLIVYSQDTIHVPLEYPTIQEGINAATNGDIVLVEDGTYIENINYRGKAITVASLFLLNGDESHIQNTIIDGSQPSHPDSGSVVYFVSGEDTNSVLCGFTITGGSGTYMPESPPNPEFRMGGGILVVFAGAKICHNIIKNNSIANAESVMGGGLVNGPPGSAGFIIVENNIFDSNSCVESDLASQGGGLQLSGRFKVYNNIFSNNLVSSTYGEAFGGGFAGILNLDSALVYDNIFINNKAETLYGTGPKDHSLGGGFIIWDDSTAFVRVIGNIVAYNELISSNRSFGAGGTFEKIDGDVLFVNNLVYDNYYSGTAYCHGTGLSIHGQTVVSIINNTITGNEASIYGGALYSWDTTQTTSTLAMNNIFWGNSVGTAHPEIFVGAGNSPNIVYCDVQGGWPGEGNIDEDPLFIIGDTLFHLSGTSPCVNKGADSLFHSGQWYFCPPYDYEGDERPYMGRDADIGADETKVVPVGIESETAGIPQTYELYQNYPNPFNPSTKISWQSSIGSWQTLKVYDVLGNEVAKLVDEYKPAGQYEVNFDSHSGEVRNLPSGVYSYQIRAGDFISTKKMLLLK